MKASEKSAFKALVLIGIEVLVWQQYAIPFFAFIALTIQLVKFARNTHDPSKIVVWGMVFVCGVGGNIFNNHVVAPRGAERIIAACEAYHADHGQYPDVLGALVPEYLERIPRAKVAVAFSVFMYYGPRHFYKASGQTDPYLSWVYMPPFGRYVYDFESKTWRSVD